MLRPLALVTLLLCSAAAEAKGRYKFIDLKTMPKKATDLAGLLRAMKEKDPSKRAAASLLLDDSLREKSDELKNASDAEAVLTVLLEKTFKDMAGVNDIYGWNKDENAPRADMLCKKLLVLPGRVSPGYSHKFNNTILAKHADQGGVQGKTCDTEVAAAKNDAEFYAWVANQGWGILPYAVMINEEGVTRGGFQFLSPGNTSYPAPRFERPTYIGFAEKKDDQWTLVANEPALYNDWHKQECNIYPPESSKISEQEKRARVANWMESIRGVNPGRDRFMGSEVPIFKIDGPGNDKFEKSELPMIEPYQNSDNPMVKAAAQIKSSQLGGGVSAAVMGETMAQLKSLPARSELGKAIFKIFGPSLDAGNDASAEDKAAIEKVLKTDSPWQLGRVNWVKVYEDWGKVSVSNMPCTFFLVRQNEDKTWRVLGPIM